ncbi:MAG: bifunctional riboflavin kinase/FAD synthetase [Actinomycetaceae bacterium]|nr:bifunctional riboflavin kinase/FAD synthetase [Actinomycetaceae bacterium]
MTVWRGLEEVPSRPRTVATIGNFDGVHRGHQKLARTCVDRAREREAIALAITFYPHPVQVHAPEKDLRLITTLEDRLDALAGYGIDATLVLEYNEKLYEQSPREFIENLVKTFDVMGIVVGEDVKFGKDNSGDIGTLTSLGEEFGFEVFALPDIESAEGKRWSSSWIRELLDEGDVREAARVLGRPHRIRGIVQHGAKRGREMGFPTANLDERSDGVIPADGVYAGWLIRRVEGQPAGVFMPAAISVGTNPQFDGEIRTVEAHVLGRSDLNLYGEEVAISFIERLRDMKSFESVDALLEQMDDDIRDAASILGVAVSGRVDPESVTAR